LLVQLKNKTIFGATPLLDLHLQPPKVLSFGGSKEEVLIFISTEGILFPLHFLGGFVPSGSLGSLGIVSVDYSHLYGILAFVAFLGASN
jgi:hypothetical protein